jgi:hypothetical protein
MPGSRSPAGAHTRSYRAGAGIAALGGLLGATAIAAPAQAATAWTVTTTPNRGSIANELFGTAALSPTSAWAVGSWYDTSIAAPRTLIQRWNGTAWTTVTSPNSTSYYNELHDVDAVSATNAWAVGYANGSSGVNGAPRNTLAMRWNGTTWSIVPTPQPGTQTRDLYGVKAFSTTDAWAVGWYYDTSFTAEALALHFNGSTWTQVTAPGPGTRGNSLTAVAGVAPDDLWAVGTYNDTGDTRGLVHPLAMHYNGSGWVSTPMPQTAAGGYLRAVTALARNDVWAVGSKNGYATPVAYHWNGTAWSEIPTAAPGGSGGNNVFYGVAGTATGQVWAVGYRSTGNGPQPMIQRWNGTAFATETVPALPIGGLLYAVAATTGPKVFAAGTQSDLINGSLADRTLSIRGAGS